MHITQTRRVWPSVKVLQNLKILGGFRPVGLLELGALTVLALFFLLAPAQAQKIQSDWIDVEGKNQQEIIEILQAEIQNIRVIAETDESGRSQAEKRRSDIEQKERLKRGDFLNKLLKLNTNISKSTLALTDNTNQVQQLETKQKVLEGRLKAVEDSRKRLFQRLKLIPQQSMLIGSALQKDRDMLTSAIERFIHYKISRKSIEVVNGEEVIAKTLVANRIPIQQVIQTKLEGTANAQIYKMTKFVAVEGTQVPEVYVWGVYDVYPLAEIDQSKADLEDLKLKVDIKVIKNENDIISAIDGDMRASLIKRLHEVRKFNQDSIESIQDAIKEEQKILQENAIQLNEEEIKQLKPYKISELRQGLEKLLELVKTDIATLKLQTPQLKQSHQHSFAEYHKKRSEEVRIDVMMASVVHEGAINQALRKLMSQAIKKFYNEDRTLSLNELSMTENGRLMDHQSKKVTEPALIKNVQIIFLIGASRNEPIYRSAVAIEYGFHTDLSATPVPSLDKSNLPISEDNVPWIWGLLFLPILGLGALVIKRLRDKPSNPAEPTPLLTELQTQLKQAEKQHNENKGKIKRYEEQVNNLRQQIAALENQLKQAEKQHNENKGKIKRYEEQVNNLRQQIAALENQLKKLNTPSPAQVNEPSPAKSSEVSSTPHKIPPKLKEQGFVWIEPGSFLMGSPEGEGDNDEHPQHPVELTQGFYLCDHPVTVGEFKRFARDHKAEAELGDGAWVWTGTEWAQKSDANWSNPYLNQTDDHPVVCVSWNDAQAYIAWLNKREGKKVYRLPSEAEWEYACRAGTSKWWGDDAKDLQEVAWFSGNNTPFGTKPVKTRQKNPRGLYDMLGNVWEWVEDVYKSDIYQQQSPDGKKVRVDPIYTGSGDNRVFRGGSWNVNPGDVRCAYRYLSSPTHRAAVLGFRLARTD